jgi:lysophospholipase L1-like esterase
LIQRRPFLFRLAAVAFGTLLGLLLIGLAVAALGLDLRRMAFRARQLVFPDKVLWIHRLDPVLGYTLLPYAESRHRTEQFDVTYRIGPDGGRVVPGAAADGRPIVEILGDSWTFGHGVEDDETYAAVLQRQFWPTATVRNRGVMGYGTVQAMLALERDLEAPSPPDLVLYGWQWFHNGRNHLRQSNLDVAAGGRVPLVEVRDGRPVVLGLAGKEAAIADDDPGLEETEWQVTEAALRHMDELSRRRGARFVVLLLPGRPTDQGRILAAIPRLSRFLDEAGIEYLNMDQDGQFPLTEDDYFPIDFHPNAAWHSRVAAYIAEHLDLGPATSSQRPGRP